MRFFVVTPSFLRALEEPVDYVRSNKTIAVNSIIKPVNSLFVVGFQRSFKQSQHTSGVVIIWLFSAYAGWRCRFTGASVQVIKRSLFMQAQR